MIEAIVLIGLELISWGVELASPKAPPPLDPAAIVRPAIDPVPDAPPEP